MCQVEKIHFAQKYLASSSSLFVHTYGFKQCNISAQILHLYGFSEVVIFIKSCLYCLLFTIYVAYTTARPICLGGKVFKQVEQPFCGLDGKELGRR